MSVIRNQDGHETLVVHRATASKLAHYLDPSVPWVWILGHMPNRAIRWWTSSVPLNTNVSITGRIRGLTYDLQLPTAEFLCCVSDFDEHGLVLIQANREMPDTLDLSRLRDSQQDSVLIQNGAVMRMYLPHAIETAVIVCYREGLLAKSAP